MVHLGQIKLCLTIVRKKWFQYYLVILDHNNLETLAMPYGIEYGLAGGKWEDYKNIIKKCSTKNKII